MIISFSNRLQSNQPIRTSPEFFKIAFSCEYQKFESSFSDPQPIMAFEKVLQNTIN